MPTKFNDIVFDPVSHGYKIGNKNLVSVTTLLKSVVPEFDSHSISLRTAEKLGITQADVLRQWEEKGERGRDRGTRLHQYVEDTMAGVIDPVLRLVNDRLLEMDAFDQAWAMLRGELDAKMVKQEFVVGDEEFGVAGRVDNLMSIALPKSVSRIASIFDWKTGKFEIDNRYSMLLPPFDAYSDCELNKYSIQLSLYRLILERNKPDIRLSDGYLLHLRSDGSHQLHRARDFRNEIAEWLKSGIPDDVKSDSAFEKRAVDVVKVMNSVADKEFMSQISRRACQKLERAVRSVLVELLERLR